MNNYEKIKNMTIEEMVMFLDKDCPHCIYGETFCVDCKSGVKQWLESEVENERQI